MAEIIPWNKDEKELLLLRALANRLASSLIDGDTFEGREYMADGNDEEIEIFYGLVHEARRILGHKDPMEV
jgi:hypothetical protein